MINNRGKLFIVPYTRYGVIVMEYGKLTFGKKSDKKSILKQGFSWGANTLVWDEESEELVDEVEELRERAMN